MKRKNDLLNEEMAVPLEHMVNGELLPLQCKELSTDFDFEQVYRDMDGEPMEIQDDDYREGLLAIAKFVFNIPKQHKSRSKEQVVIKMVTVFYLMLGNQFFSTSPNDQSRKGYQLNISVIQRMLKQEFGITTSRQNVLKYIKQFQAKGKS